MAGEEVKLLGLWESPFVLRVGIALNLKSIAFEFLEEVFGTKSELLLKSNPVYKKMPVFIHGDKAISESMIIVQYINEAWAKVGPSILPSDPYDRSLARFWAVYIDDKFFPSVFGIVMAKSEEAMASAVEQAGASLQILEEAFVKCSKGKDFFGGDNIGYLDIALGCLLSWMGAAEVFSGVKLLDEAKTPRLVSWAELFRTHDATKEILVDPSKLVEFGKKLQGN